MTAPTTALELILEEKVRDGEIQTQRLYLVLTDVSSIRPTSGIHALETLGRVGMGWVRWSTRAGPWGVEDSPSGAAPDYARRGGYLASPHLVWCSTKLPLFFQIF
jgi:hypothetical protein